ncbi:two-component system response regulator BtsR [Shewanella ulleungensis]|jgi:two-component system LytT family response regulator|uniref:Response regulatory protein n=1 Tax=Shewanella ulleungensis TaxID=2282699 RepID=A0ABQ2QPF6_9GAMM|nr:two-component system response regulator BtsR [Shewanella ulleungensis]MCL1151435.1 two-component system response regulator BtsR [Shewanella ulleungensis]GGP90917.1 putative response regulatory protein [Shewanella ulleungensis]
MIRCLIIDDEPFARQEVADLLEKHADIEVLAQCGNAIEALQHINRLKPDLIFVDIQMPRINGMELIAMLNPEQMPRAVFITAFDEYAVKAFDNNAFDYLLKPIDENRFNQTLDKVRTNIAPQLLAPILPKQLAHLPCYSGSKLKVITTADVEFIVSDVGGIHVHCRNGFSHTHLTLKVLEEKTALFRCHKQYLISPDAISEIEITDTGADVTTHSGAKVPVSRRYLKELKQLLGFQ